jgi:type I restriction enzyme S subunit
MSSHAGRQTWTTVRLGDVGRIVSGATPRTDNPAYWEGDILWVTPKDLSGHDAAIITETGKAITAAGLASCSAEQLPVGTVLFSSRAPIGLTAITGAPMATNQGFKSVVPGPGIDSGFLYWALRHFGPSIANRAPGTTFKEVNKAAMENVRIPLPPLPEQRRIAALLDKADAIRRKRQQAIRLAAGLLRSAFLDMFGDATRGRHPWARVPLSALCSAIVDCPHSTPRYAAGRTAYPCIRTSDLQHGFLDFSTTKYVDIGEYRGRIAREIPVTGDVLYSREGERFGMAAMVPLGVTPCLGQRMMLLRADESAVRPTFLWALMNSSAFYSRVAQLAGGSTSPHVNVADIKRLPAFLPPLALQTRFERVVETLAVTRKRMMGAGSRGDDLFCSLVNASFRAGTARNPIR